VGERVLVVGGAGFIGSHLVDALIARGDVVRVLDDLLPQAHPTGTARWAHGEAELVVGDVRDRAAVDAALEGVTLVFHQAGMVGNGQSMYDVRRYTDVNVVGTATLIEAILARRAQLRRFVVASSMVVYGDGAYACEEHGALSRALRPESRLLARQWEPVCPVCGREVTPIPTGEDHALQPSSTYGISKLAQEQLALVLGKANGLPTIALRYLNTYGSRQAMSNPYTGVAAIMAARLLNGRPPTIFEDGQQLRDLTHVSDVVRANLAAAGAPEDALYLAYNIGTGRSVRIEQIARALARELGRDIEPEITGEFRAGDIRHCFADVSRARSLLGWEAKVTFAEGAQELAAWAAGEQPEDLTERANAELRAKGLLSGGHPGVKAPK
jgi:dTDP-L-rhamnose 4-epimerase